MMSRIAAPSSDVTMPIFLGPAYHLEPVPKNQYMTVGWSDVYTRWLNLLAVTRVFDSPIASTIQ